MSFVIEKISQNNINEFGLDQYNRYYGITSVVGGTLAIDNERKTCLRLVRYDFSRPGAARYLFIWNGISIDITLMASTGNDGKVNEVNLAWDGMHLFDNGNKDRVVEQRENILQDFKEALKSKKDADQQSANTKYNFNF